MTRQSDIINANFKFLDNKIKEIELFKSPNVIIQGNPTITNGQVTGLSKTDYLILPFEFDVKDRGFELTYCFRTGADVTTPQNLYGSKFSIASYVSSGKLTIRVSSNGTSWNVLDLITDLDIQPNTTYYIKLIFNRLSYTVKYSTDGVEYTQINNVVNPNAPAKGDIYLGIGNNQNNPFLGMLNLHKWELKFNNSVFWEGMDDAGLATRADISLSNLDEVGEKRFTDIHDALDTKQPVGDYATNTALNDGLTTKQDIIPDLVTIRDNAQTGKNASDTIATYGNIVTHNANEFQPAGDYATNTALTQGLATKQDVIDDLEEIRSNAQAGKDIIPQVNVNTQRIEDLTVARFPNVIVKGTPQIIGGQVSGFSDVNYLQFPFVDISRGYPFDIYFSFTTANDVTNQQNVLDAYFGIALAIQNGKGIMALSSNGTSWDIGTAIGTNTLTPNTTYYVKYSWTGTAYSAALSQDEQSYVPDMNLESTLSPHKTTIFIGGSPNIFGAGSAHPFKGTINFNKSKVVVNGITVWEGMADVGLASRANVSLNNLDEVGEARFTNILNETGSELDYTGTTLSLNNAKGDTLSTVTIKSTPNLDNSTISLNASDELQAIGVIEKNKGLAKYDWVGTLEEYRALPVKASDTLYNVTDDSNVIDIRTLGQIVQSTIPLVDAGLHLLDGSVIAYGSYKAFVDYMAGLVTDYPDLFTSEANWQTSVTNYGVCGKFVYDSVGKTVRLPKYSNKIYSSLPSELGVKGNGMTLGLTDGTYNYGMGITGGNGNYGGDATKYGSSVGETFLTTSTASRQKMTGITTDPTKSGIIADLSTITTALDGYWYICVATYPKTQIEVDIDEIATDLNGKVDKANLMECQVVVETWHDGTEWYRVWSDGWCEQGGLIATPTGATYTITLLKHYANTNYNIVLQNFDRTNKRADTNTTTTITGQSIDEFTFHTYGSVGQLEVSWEAKGYIR